MAALSYYNLMELNYFKINTNNSDMYQEVLNIQRDGNFFLESTLVGIYALKTQAISLTIYEYLVHQNNVLGKKINLINSAFYVYLVYCAVIIFFITYVFMFLKNKKDSFLQISNKINKLMGVSEKEIMPIDDIFFFIFFFVFVFSSYFATQIVFSIINSNVISMFFYSMLLVKILILTVPLNLIYDYRLQVFTYIRGCTNTSNVFIELLLDIIAVNVVFIRFLVQNVRYLFIILSLYEIFHFFYTYTNFNLVSISGAVTSHNPLININIGKNAVFVLINFIFIFIVHIGHFIVLTTIQILIYILISFWLFYFFYTSFFFNSIEAYFTQKIK